MSTGEARQESDLVLLLAGLVAVLGLGYVSLLAMAGGWAMSLLVGAAELLLAWRVSPPQGARVLRPITVVFGLVTVAWAVVLLVGG